VNSIHIIVRRPDVSREGQVSTYKSSHSTTGKGRRTSRHARRPEVAWGDVHSVLQSFRNEHQQPTML
jgi:hypothetical protein